MDSTKIEIVLQGYFCNHWPELTILLNNEKLFVGSIVDQQVLVFDVRCQNVNKLEFVHHSKQFGENNVWDTEPTTGADCKLQIVDIKFDQVSIGKKLRSELEFTTQWSDTQLSNESKDFLEEFSTIKTTDGWMAFNGSTVLGFELPVYDWLILEKFKVKEEGDKAFYSNFTKRWHFDQDIVVLNEIRDLMDFDENCCNSDPQT